ncbi:nucleoside recognition domain-containing protein [Desulfurispira natronophila]|uniref:Nucleoside transporter/FeoB GTPase Gate domain-containing protein n=1 Tax=Desulfurispira natronophila TaxID=682562 RepID=A0A7W7Y522_9BACT|nr:nucleoside recognition domain-containing protein [Desulfurispira natronophila]MBB5021942.1 hypothetical protein [Desulfurispira natronophila]
MTRRSPFPLLSTPLKGIANALKQAGRISLVLFRILIPIIIIIKILQELGLVELLGQAMAPLMALVGLPGSMGIVFATALLTNLYGGMIAFAALFAAENLTVAQVTVLATMMLVAHNFPIELAVARKAGVRLGAAFLIRFLGAFAVGALLFHTYRLGDWLQRDAILLWSPPAADPTLVQWALGEVRNLLAIFVIILVLVIALKIMERLRINHALEWLLRPVLSRMGIGPAATNITLVGMVLGLAYGGGLIIREAQSGKIPPRDVFASLALMGLTHSLIEDTLLMMLMGGHISGLLWGRLVFSIIVVFLLMKVMQRVPDSWFYRYAFHPR